MCERQILCKIETTKQVGSGPILSLAQQKKNTFQIKNEIYTAVEAYFGEGSKKRLKGDVA